MEAYLPGKKLICTAFDLALTNGQRNYSLKAPVWFTFTIPDELASAKSYVLLHMKADGSVEQIPLRQDGKQLSALTASFSTFVLLAGTEDKDSGEESEPAPVPPSPDDDKKEESTDDKGDTKDSGNGQKTTNIAAVRKSPATYDNSVFTPGSRKTEAADKEEQENGMSGILAAADTAGKPINNGGWLFALAVAASCCCGVTAGLRAYYKKEEE